MPLATSHSQNQIVQTTPAKNIDMVAGVWASTRIESIRFVWHFVCYHGDLGRVVAGYFPAFAAHVAGREEVDGSISLAHHDPMVDEAVGGGDRSV